MNPRRLLVEMFGGKCQTFPSWWQFPTLFPIGICQNPNDQKPQPWGSWCIPSHWEVDVSITEPEVLNLSWVNWGSGLGTGIDLCYAIAAGALRAAVLGWVPSNPLQSISTKSIWPGAAQPVWCCSAHTHARGLAGSGCVSVPVCAPNTDVCLYACLSPSSGVKQALTPLSWCGKFAVSWLWAGSSSADVLLIRWAGCWVVKCDFLLEAEGWECHSGCWSVCKEGQDWGVQAGLPQPCNDTENWGKESCELFLFTDG